MRLGWRVNLIGLVWFISVALTASVYLLGLWHDPLTHMGAVFAAWVGGLALFTVIGAAAALVSLAQPEHDSFDARARILFRGQNGAHIDYIISSLRNLFEHYAESTKVAICICRQSVARDEPGDVLYRLHDEKTFKFKSYIDDIASTYKSDLEYLEVTAPPPGEEHNKLAFIRIDGKEQVESRHFTDSIKFPLQATILPNSEFNTEMKVEYWVKSNEANNFVPVRYTKALLLEFENQLITDAVDITVTRAGREEETFRLNSGGRKMQMEIKDLLPNIAAYTFKIAPASGR